MLSTRAVLAAVATAGFWPAAGALASDISSLPGSDFSGQQQHVQRATLPSQSTGIRSEGRSLGLRVGRYSALPPPAARDIHPLSEPAYSSPTEGFRYGYERATGESRLEELRYGLTLDGGIGSARQLVPTAIPPRAGWGWSGRLGPLRWLGDSDGETRLRLGSRVPGQPQMSGMGTFNLGIHYTFE